MEYVVYCDESRHEGPSNHPYMAIGSLWLPRENKAQLTEEFKMLCQSCGLGSEVKWSKTSSKYLSEYKQIIDFFFERETIRYRVIVIEHSRVDVNRYHEGDRELGFYKFYYQLLKQWLEPGHEYLILLDFKRNKGSGRYSTLKTYLERSVRGKAWISDLTVIDSSQAPLAQLCDLLTGAVAAAWCQDLIPGSPKELLAQYLAGKRGVSTLRLRNANPQPSKFNIFHPSLT